MLNYVDRFRFDVVGIFGLIELVIEKFGRGGHQQVVSFAQLFANFLVAKWGVKIGTSLLQFLVIIITIFAPSWYRAEAILDIVFVNHIRHRSMMLIQNRVGSFDWRREKLLHSK